MLYNEGILFVSFYNSEKESQEVNALVDGAKRLVEAKQASGEWTKREVHWYRVNMDEHPELAKEVNDQPDQLVIATQIGTDRRLHFALDESASKDAEEARLAQMVKELSGDWYTEIECEQLQADERFYYDEVVYFGDAKDLQGDGHFAATMNAVSIQNRYEYDHMRAGFYFVTDPGCRVNYGLQPDGKYMMILNGPNSPDEVVDLTNAD
mmetsp:Transcript_34816/g.45830  ORF Transcript_34816/g.45830 Transcript_34816/m.45830 type:complete len:209 (-) Transcript_34816:812-1438(-)